METNLHNEEIEGLNREENEIIYFSINKNTIV